MRRIEIRHCPACGRYCDVYMDQGEDTVTVQQMCMGCGEILATETVPTAEGFYLDMGVVPTDAKANATTDGKEGAE